MEAAAWLGAMASLILLLLAASIGWHAPGGRFKAYLLLWLLTLAALALAPIYNTPLLPAWLRLLLYSAANLSPMSSALLLFLLFEDRDIGGRSFWLLAGLAVGLDSFDLAMSLQQNWPNDRLGIALFEYLPQLLKIGFLGLSLYGLLRSWRAELIQGRWRLRHVALGLGMLIGAEMLIVENLWAVQHALPYDAAGFHATWQLALALGLCLALLRPRPLASWSPAPLSSPEPAVNEPGRGWLDWRRKRCELQALLEQQEIYRDPGLNLAGLARALAIPEYRARQLINGELGYRNFNVFMNDYRSRAAARALADPALAHLPILTIAMDVGYASLAPFNRAFRERFQMTPSEYRQQQRRGESDAAQASVVDR
ncbi:MAG: helix-turn-helix transcriptional regulator [Xanthomonadales bacterium]|nr:helix-turn-helix transcriptional regulator [Xanthomonadales bacterium]